MQSFILKVVPRSWAEDMERESRQWMVTCGNCDYAESVWDLGGIRWKAAGNPRTRRRCPNCGETGWHVIAKQSE
jgi:ribosomal protein S27AE